MRDPIEILNVIKATLDRCDNSRRTVYDVTDAILTDSEREAVARARELRPDERTEDDFDGAVKFIAKIHKDTVWHAPETLWNDIGLIGGACLRQVEILEIEVSRGNMTDEYGELVRSKGKSLIADRCGNDVKF